MICGRLSILAVLLVVGCHNQPSSSDSVVADASATKSEVSTEVMHSDANQDTQSSSNADSRAESQVGESVELQLSGSEPDSSDLGTFRWWKDSGVDFVRNDDMRGLKRIFESTGGGVGVLDFDRDGWPDLCFTGGCKVPEELNSNKPTCGLYRNRISTHSRLEECTLQSKFLKSGFCQGVAAGDYDNDGFGDIYITAFGHNSLFHNQGDGTFVELTSELGVDDERWSTGCVWADVNLDGLLDLYVANYLNDSPTNPLLCLNEKSPTGHEQCPPSKYQGVNDRLFLGDGRGGFIDVTDSSGLKERLGKGLGVMISNLDSEGLPEIYVANDGQANFLFKIANDEKAGVTIEELGMSSGVALSRAGYAQASMGIAAGDYDNDGDIDIHITNFYGDSNILYQNQGNLQFEDVTRSTGLAGPSRNVLGWGTVMLDYDGDNLLDLFVANGHVEDRTWNGRSEPFEMQAQLFRNVGRGKFEETSARAGDYFKEARLGRGVAVVDLNRDQLADLVIANQMATPGLLLRQEASVKPVVVELIGTRSNRDAIGTTITVSSSGGELRAFRELTAGTSFQSTQEYKLYLVGQPSDKLSILWPSGISQELEFPKDERVIFVEPK